MRGRAAARQQRAQVRGAAPKVAVDELLDVRARLRAHLRSEQAQCGSDSEDGAVSHCKNTTSSSQRAQLDKET